jgi:hypothetical protein
MISKVNEDAYKDLPGAYVSNTFYKFRGTLGLDRHAVFKTSSQMLPPPSQSPPICRYHSLLGIISR